MTEQHDAKQQAITEVNRLAKLGGGRITPRALVDAARDPDSPLHSFFEWDDSEAAEKYREMQARTLLRSCTRREVIHKRRVEIPMYVRDPDCDTTEQGYVETAKIRTDEDAARDLLVAEFKRATALIARARALSAFFELEAEFLDVEESMDLLGRRISERTGAELRV